MSKTDKSRKYKGMKLTIEVPNEKLLKHIVDAYGLVCQYRTANRVPHESMEKWLLRLAVEGANALYNFHNEALKKQQEEAAAKAEAEAKTDSTEEQADDSQAK